MKDKRSQAGDATPRAAQPTTPNPTSHRSAPPTAAKATLAAGLLAAATACGPPSASSSEHHARADECPDAALDDARNRLNVALRWDNEANASEAMADFEAHATPACVRRLAYHKLLWAAVRSNLGPAYVPRLLAVGLDPNLSDVELDPLCEGCTASYQGMSALHFATFLHDERRFFRFGGNGNKKPVTWASRRAIVRALLEGGADPNLTTTSAYWGGGGVALRIGGATPLMYVSRWVDAETALDAQRALLDAGAAINPRSWTYLMSEGGGSHIRGGETPLAVAERLGHEPLAAALREHGGVAYDVEAEWAAATASSPEEAASAIEGKLVGADHIWTLRAFEQRNDFEVGTLLDAGIAPDVWLWGNKNGPPLATLFETLAYTRVPQRHNVIRLIEAGADVNLAGGWTGDTPLLTLIHHHWGHGSWPDIRPELVDRLLQAGAEVNAADPKGVSPLIAALINHGNAGPNPALVDRLLEAGADPNHANDWGHRPLTLAVRQASTLDVFETLLDAGADLNAEVRGLPVWAYVLRFPTNHDEHDTARILVLLEHVVHHPSLVIDLSRPEVLEALDEADDNPLVAPLVEVIRARAE